MGDNYILEVKITDIITNVILSLGIMARRNNIYEIVIPAMSNKESMCQFEWPRNTKVISTKDIPNKPEHWKIAKVIEFGGNKFVFLGGFYTYKGRKNDLKDIYSFYDKYEHDGISVKTNSHRIGFSYHYRKINKENIDEAYLKD